MGVFDLMAAAGGYEQVVHCYEPAVGLRAIVAIHSTALGPALGGTRFYPFPDEQSALVDVLRLARGMSYKAAVAGLALGGGKAVIIGDPRTDRTDALIETYARFIDSLGGRYITAEDVGTTQADMDLIATVTRHVTGTTAGSGDPSPATAHGVLAAMRAVARFRWGAPTLEGRHVVIAGVGKVGGALADLVAADGARLTVADVDPMRAAAVRERLGAAVVPPEDAHRVPCDVFSPCALGAVLNERSIPELACEAVCGSANNQLATDEDDNRLHERGITYAPDYVVNAGGLINIFEELGGYDAERAFQRVEHVFDATSEILADAERDGITTAEAADRLAERRIAAAGPVGIRRFDR